MSNNNHATVPKNKIMDLPSKVRQQEPNVMPLTDLQREYLQQYAISLNQASAKVAAAKEAVKLAEEAEGVAQNAANNFLRYCAEDLHIDLRNWTFDQANLQFVRTVRDENV